MNKELIIIAHNIRSCHNIGSLLRTAEGLGITRVYLTGYTPYPEMPNDSRLPHLSKKITSQIHKTALGAENSVNWAHYDEAGTVIEKLRADGFIIAGLEQAPSSKSLNDFKPPEKLAVVLRSEATGMDADLLDLTDFCIEIPMKGSKESFNVVEAATMLMYHCTYIA